jgi:DNA-damage-inducible protein D
MTDLIIGLQKTNKESLFDSIRHIDENGQEYWIARELMEVLGYKAWQKFKIVIEDAIESAREFTDQVDNHFIPVEIKNIDGNGNRLKGRTGIDYKLTRFGSYHIALSCDSRGNRPVKLARNYFVIKTREAEVIIPQQNDEIRKLELQLAISNSQNAGLRLQKNIIEKAETVITIHGLPVYALMIGRPDAVVEVETKVTETVVCKGNSNVSFTGSSTAEVGRKYGFTTGTKLVEWLKSMNAEHLVCQGIRAVQAAYIPCENLEEIKNLWMQNQHRQILLGE